MHRRFMQDANRWKGRVAIVDSLKRGKVLFYRDFSTLRPQV